MTAVILNGCRLEQPKPAPGDFQPSFPHRPGACPVRPFLGVFGIAQVVFVSTHALALLDRTKGRVNRSRDWRDSEVQRSSISLSIKIFSKSLTRISTPACQRPAMGNRTPPIRQFVVSM